VWPYLEWTSVGYRTYEDALVRAREHARAKTVNVWRNRSIDPQKPVLENVGA
jgi:hypothetical protein